MFALKLNEPRILNACISVISDFITEASFAIDKDGIKLVAMDPENISMVILNLLPSVFSEYSVETNSEITVNLDKLKQALKRVKPTDSLALTLDKNKLKITVYGKSVKRFYIPLLEREAKERKIPSFDFMATAVADAIRFEADKNIFVISGGDVGSKVTVELTKGNDALLSVAAAGAVGSIYSAEYLKKMARAAALADTVVVQFAKDYPLKLDFRSLNKLQMAFVLAPRIENK